MAELPTVDDLRLWVGGDQPPTPSAAITFRLTEALASAADGVVGACQARYVDDTDPDFTEYPQGVRQGILLVAHRLYTRASSPQGVAGFDSLGNVYRILATDPDVKGVLGPYIDHTKLFA